MKGIPKMYVTDIPMRPVISSTGNTPHKLEKRLANPLRNAQGSLNKAQLRNSSDLINRSHNCDVRAKEMASFDVLFSLIFL